MWAVTVMDACPMAFCNRRRSAPARRDSDAYVWRASLAVRQLPERPAGAHRVESSARALNVAELAPSVDLLQTSGLPSTSLPPTWVIERRIRMRLAVRSTSSTFNPVSSPNLRPV